MDSFALTFVLCCFNSEKRLPRVLELLALQDFEEPFEVIVVDNRSTDSTRQVGTRLTAMLFGKRGRVVSEDRPGRMHAILRGISEACGTFVCFVDDDNLLDRGYARLAVQFLRNHPEVGAVGGESLTPADLSAPDWFASLQSSYAIGPQGEREGPVASGRGLWGAGLTVRRQIVSEVLASDWRPTLLGRAGPLPTSGDDSELVAIIRLLGWDLWYLPALKLEHAIARERIDPQYVVRLFEGFGRAAPIVFEYHARHQQGNIVRRGLRLLRRLRAVNLLWATTRYGVARVRSWTAHGPRRVPALAHSAYYRGQIEALLHDRPTILQARRNAAICAALRNGARGPQ